LKMVHLATPPNFGGERAGTAKVSPRYRRIGPSHNGPCRTRQGATASSPRNPSCAWMSTGALYFHGRPQR
jgi:hypothetical protein